MPIRTLVLATTMQLRTPLLAALGILFLATAPALAAPTALQKLEKKVARYAQPIAALDITKPRGLCTCGPNEPEVPAGGTGVLAYEILPLVGAQLVSVTCQVPAIDGVGGVLGFETCLNWTLKPLSPGAGPTPPPWL